MEDERLLEKALFAWCNSVLNITPSIKSASDFKDGRLFLRLIYAISPASLGSLPIPTSSEQRIQQFANVNRTLKIIQDSWQFPLESLYADEILKGHSKAVSTVLWKIALKDLAGHEDLLQQSTAATMKDPKMTVTRRRTNSIKDKNSRMKKELLLWCHKYTNRSAGDSILDFTSRWKSGKLFMEILACYNHQLLSGVDREKLAADPVAACDFAFTMFQSELGVPKLFDGIDIQGELFDEKPILFYVSLISRAIRIKQLDFSSLLPQLKDIMEKHKEKINEMSLKLDSIYIAMDFMVNASEMIKESETDGIQSESMRDISAVSKTLSSELETLRTDVNLKIHLAQMHFLRSSSPAPKSHEISAGMTTIGRLYVDTVKKCQDLLTKTLKKADVVEKVEMARKDITNLFSRINDYKHALDGLLSDKSLLAELELEFELIEKAVQNISPWSEQEEGAAQFNQAWTAIMKKLSLELTGLSSRLNENKKVITAKMSPEEMYISDVAKTSEWIRQKTKFVEGIQIQDDHIEKMVQDYSGTVDDSLDVVSANLALMRIEMGKFEVQIKRLREQCLKFGGTLLKKAKPQEIQALQKEVDESWIFLRNTLQARITLVDLATSVRDYLSNAYKILDEFDIINDDVSVIPTDIPKEETQKLLLSNENRVLELDNALDKIYQEYEQTLFASPAAMSNYQTLERISADLKQNLLNRKNQVTEYHLFSQWFDKAMDLEDGFTALLKRLSNLPELSEESVIGFSSPLPRYQKEFSDINEKYEVFKEKIWVPLLSEYQELQHLKKDPALRGAVDESLEDMNEFYASVSHLHDLIEPEIQSCLETMRYMEKVSTAFSEGDSMKKKFIEITEDLTTIPPKQFLDKVSVLSQTFSDEQTKFTTWIQTYGDLFSSSSLLSDIHKKNMEYVTRVTTDFSKKISDISILKAYDETCEKLKILDETLESTLKQILSITVPFCDKIDVLTSTREKFLKIIYEFQMSVQNFSQEYENIKEIASKAVDFKPDLRAKLQNTENNIQRLDETVVNKKIDMENHFNLQNILIEMQKMRDTLGEAKESFNESCDLFTEEEAMKSKDFHSLNALSKCWTDVVAISSSIRNRLVQIRADNVFEHTDKTADSTGKTGFSKLALAPTFSGELETIFKNSVKTIETELNSFDSMLSDTKEAMEEIESRTILYRRLCEENEKLQSLSFKTSSSDEKSSDIDFLILSLQNEIAVSESLVLDCLSANCLRCRKFDESAIITTNGAIPMTEEQLGKLQNLISEGKILVERKLESVSTIRKLLSIAQMLEPLENELLFLTGNCSELSKISLEIVETVEKKQVGLQNQFDQIESALNVTRNVELEARFQNCKELNIKISKICSLGKQRLEKGDRLNSLKQLVVQYVDFVSKKHDFVLALVEMSDREIIESDQPSVRSELEIFLSTMNSLISEMKTFKADSTASLTNNFVAWDKEITAELDIEKERSDFVEYFANMNAEIQELDDLINSKLSYHEHATLVAIAHEEMSTILKMVHKLQNDIEEAQENKDGINETLIAEFSCSFDNLGEKLEVWKKENELAWNQSAELKSEYQNFLSVTEQLRALLKNVSTEHQEFRFYYNLITRTLSLFNNIRSVDDSKDDESKDNLISTDGEHVLSEIQSIEKSLEDISSEEQSFVESQHEEKSNYIEEIKNDFKSSKLLIYVISCLIKTYCELKREYSHNMKGFLDAQSATSLTEMADRLKNFVLFQQVEEILERAAACQNIIIKGFPVCQELKSKIAAYSTRLIPSTIADLKQITQLIATLNDELLPEYSKLNEDITALLKEGAEKLFKFDSILILEKDFISLEKSSFAVKERMRLLMAKIVDIFGENSSPLLLKRQKEMDLQMASLENLLGQHRVLKEAYEEADTHCSRFTQNFENLEKSSFETTVETEFSDSCIKIKDLLIDLESQETEWNHRYALENITSIYKLSATALFTKAIHNFEACKDRAQKFIAKNEAVIKCFHQLCHTEKNLREKNSSFDIAISEFEMSKNKAEAPIEPVLDQFIRDCDEYSHNFSAQLSLIASIDQSFSLISAMESSFSICQKKSKDLIVCGRKLSNDKNHLLSLEGELRKISSQIDDFIQRLQATALASDIDDALTNLIKNRKFAVFDVSLNNIEQKRNQIVILKNLFKEIEPNLEAILDDASFYTDETFSKKLEAAHSRYKKIAAGLEGRLEEVQMVKQSIHLFGDLVKLDQKITFSDSPIEENGRLLDIVEKSASEFDRLSDASKEISDIVKSLVGSCKLIIGRDEELAFFNCVYYESIEEYAQTIMNDLSQSCIVFNANIDFRLKMIQMALQQAKQAVNLANVNIKTALETSVDDSVLNAFEDDLNEVKMKMSCVTDELDDRTLAKLSDMHAKADQLLSAYSFSISNAFMKTINANIEPWSDDVVKSCQQLIIEISSEIKAIDPLMKILQSVNNQCKAVQIEVEESHRYLETLEQIQFLRVPEFDEAPEFASDLSKWKYTSVKYKDHCVVQAKVLSEAKRVLSDNPNQLLNTLLTNLEFVLVKTTKNYSRLEEDLLHREKCEDFMKRIEEASYKAKELSAKIKEEPDVSEEAVKTKSCEAFIELAKYYSVAKDEFHLFRTKNVRELFEECNLLAEYNINFGSVLFWKYAQLSHESDLIVRKHWKIEYNMFHALGCVKLLKSISVINEQINISISVANRIEKLLDEELTKFTRFSADLDENSFDWDFLIKGVKYSENGYYRETLAMPTFDDIVQAQVILRCKIPAMEENADIIGSSEFIGRTYPFIIDHLDEMKQSIESTFSRLEDMKSKLIYIERIYYGWFCISNMIKWQRSMDEFLDFNFEKQVTLLVYEETSMISLKEKIWWVKLNCKYVHEDLSKVENFEIFSGEFSDKLTEITKKQKDHLKSFEALEFEFAKAIHKKKGEILKPDYTAILSV